MAATKDIPAEDQPFTLDALRREALPLGTRAIAGAEHLDNPVRWIVTASALSALPILEGGEVLLVQPGPITESWMRSAQNAGAAGLIILDPLPALALSAAQNGDLPILQLPDGCRLRNIERSVTAYLLDREASLQRRSIGIYEQLLRMAADHADLDALVHELCRILNKGVIVQDKRLHIHEHSVPPALAGSYDASRGALEDRDALPVPFQDRHKLPLHTNQTVLQALPKLNLVRLITPIVTQGVGRGYLSFLALPGTFTELDELIIQHASVVCALEMARAKAISETEKRLRGDFLDSLMLGNVSDAEAVVEGDRYGHDMTVPHIAMVVQWRGTQHPSIRRLETLVNGLSQRYPNSFITRLRDNEVRIFYKVENVNPVQAARERAMELITDARAEYPDARLAIGIGTVASRVGGWRQSYRDGLQAVDLAHKLKSDPPLYIGDLGIYMFLSKPDYRQDLLALRDSTIGNLISYEERLRSDLLQTLNAFFEAHGNHTATADALNVHRNTLTYRLARIAEITGLDLNQPDVRLAVQLSLKIHRLLGSDSA